LAKSLGREGIIHVNSSNLHASLLNSPWPVWGQINDYENTTVFSDTFKIIKTYGLRRWVALLRRWWLERQFVNKQGLTLCNSEFTKQHILDAYKPINPERFKVLYKAVDTSQFEKPTVLPPNPHSVPDKRPVVVFIGSDFYRKGLDVLIESLNLIKTPVHLSIAGVTREQFDKQFPQYSENIAGSIHSFKFHGQTSRDLTKASIMACPVILFALPLRRLSGWLYWKH
jgi:glycosyltransferase involved in cell wall biosynthesis